MSIQISIKKQDQITNQASFLTMEEALSWLSTHEGMKTFGEPARTYEQQVETVPAVIDETGAEISPAQYEMQTVTIPASYAVIIEDLTAQMEQERINAEALSFLQSTDYKVLKYRDQMDMGITPDMTVEEYQYLLQQRQQARNVIV